MSKKILAVFFYLSCCLFAQDKLLFDFDYARFAYDSTNSYLEFYYSFNMTSLKEIDINGKKSAEAVLSISIKNTATDEFVVRKNWLLTEEIENDNFEADKVGVLGFLVPKGKYNLHVEGKDRNNAESVREADEIIEIKPLIDKSYRISDIQLASRVVSDNPNVNSIFYKNTLEVIPNPTRVFTIENPVMFYYTELYNLQNSTSDYTLNKKLLNAYGKNVYEEEATFTATNNTKVEVGLLNMSKYPSGVYNLVFSLIDNATNSAVISSKRLQYSNPNWEEENQGMYAATDNMSIFNSMSIDECDDYFHISRYVTSDSDKSAWDDLETVEEKRDFLTDFWKSQDSIPETERNEFLDTYMARVKFANDNFSNALRKGYESDMGRVYVLYGRPDDREINAMSGDEHPSEIWNYMGIEQGVIFVFADLTGFGNYIQIHSTKRGEVSDANWRSRLKQTVDSQDLW